MFFYSCGQKSGEMTIISFRVPTLEELRHSLSADGLGQRSALPPTSIADINCFGVLVSDSTVIDHNNVCHDKFDEGLIYARPYKLGGFVPPGGVISIENVQQGSVQFTLVGITKDTSLPYCPFANSAPPLEAPDFSDPHFLGTTTTNIVSGVNQVTLRASFSANKLIDCEGDIFGDHASCEMFSTFENIDRNIPDCFYQNSLMESIISSSTVSSNDIYLARATSGNYYKIKIISASTSISSLDISYQSFAPDGSPVVFSSLYGASYNDSSGQLISWVEGVAYCNNLIKKTP